MTMKEYCELCGVEHNFEPITLKEAVTGAVLLKMSRKETPESAAALHNFQVALEKFKADLRKKNLTPPRASNEGSGK